MTIDQIIPHIEALIFASDKPLGNAGILEMVNNALGFIEDRATLEQVDAAVEGIAEKYNSDFYAFELRNIGGGWQFLTKKEFYKTVAQLSADKFIKKLSTAALETLSIIAYKQPITKSEIENIRGVNCDYAVQKLLEKELVVIAGRNEAAVGKPLIYTTSKSFMDYFGINSPEDLPKIREVLMEELAQPTRLQEEEEESASEEMVEIREIEEKQEKVPDVTAVAAKENIAVDAISEVADTSGADPSEDLENTGIAEKVKVYEPNADSNSMHKHSEPDHNDKPLPEHIESEASGE